MCRCAMYYLFIYPKFCRYSLIIRSFWFHLKPGLAPDALPANDLPHSSAWNASPLTLFEAKCAHSPYSWVLDKGPYTSMCVWSFFCSDKLVHVLLTPGFPRNRLSRFKGCQRLAATGHPYHLASSWVFGKSWHFNRGLLFKQLLK